MLVLTRKVGEAIVIPEFDITITLLEVNGGKVRLGIKAPAEVAVHRLEVWNRIRDLAPTDPAAEPQESATGREG